MEPLASDLLHPAHSEAKRVEVCLNRGGTVITANSRASRALHRSYADAQQSAGRAAWQTPPIYDWESWLGRLWQQHLLSAGDAPLLLSSLQERALWKRIVGSPAGDAESIAKLAAEAWRLLSDYEAHGERHRSWSGGASVDAETFRGYALAFERECRKNGWISRSDLPLLLAGTMQHRSFDLPGELVLLGFDRTTPAQERLIAAVRAAGCVVAAAHMDRGNAQPYRQSPVPSPVLIAAADQRGELEACAWWARRLLEENGKARIAVIVQQVETRREEIERVFRRILMPGALGIESSEATPYEFSLGRPLATIPVVKSALLLLRWLTGPLSQPQLSWLTLSGFLTQRGEASADYARLETEMRKHRDLPSEIPLDALALYREGHSSEVSRRFLERLRALHQSASDQALSRRAKTFPEWLDFVQSILQQAAWPGGRALESVEYQASQSWERLLGEIFLLGFDGSRVTFAQFVTVLDRYAKERIFAPESISAPIQIMGVTESSGQRFDALWFLGADDLHWPLPVGPNPLLPLPLQNGFAMPHSSVWRDWEFALGLTRRMLDSADGCVFSYARQAEGQEQRPSPILPHAMRLPLKWVPAKSFLRKLNAGPQSRARRQTVRFEDHSSVPWPRHLPAGGSVVLKEQSACAFKAFAMRRLGAAEREDNRRGLGPIDRGDILHRVFEALWSPDAPLETRLTDRDALVRFRANGQLPAILRNHIQEVFRKRQHASKTDAWMQEYLRIEQQRLHSLLLHWLNIEAGRNFFEVESHERSALVEINGLQMTIRVDRIDRIHGGRIIVDYKSGKVSPIKWEGDRPEEPQLPLYAIRGPVDDLVGLHFAQVRAGTEMGFSGRLKYVTNTVTVGGAPRTSLGKPPLDEEILGQWSDALSNLADQFLAGRAAVDPRAYPKTCATCPLGGLCRVAESALVQNVEDDADWDDDGPLADTGDE